MSRPPRAVPPPGAPYGAGNKVFTADAAAAARERMRAKLNRLNAGFNPEMMLDGLTLAGFHIEAGARTFADYAKAMIEDLGENIRPYLEHFYNSVRDYPGFDKAGMNTRAEVEEATLRELKDQDARDKIAGPRTITAEDKADLQWMVEDDHGKDDLDPQAQDVADMLARGSTAAEISEARGIDLSEHEVRALAELLNERGLIPRRRKAVEFKLPYLWR